MKYVIEGFDGELEVTGDKTAVYVAVPEGQTHVSLGTQAVADLSFAINRTVQGVEK